MRFLVLALLLAGLLTVPSASAAPAAPEAPCVATDVGCWLAYAQGRVDYVYQTAMDLYDNVEDTINNPPWCFHPVVPEVPPLIQHC